ncbi:MAG: SOS response-associated peptidase family protein [Clostridia bacterium]|nr:SOS response-associated peptidase family protein [Clostridia bacterium]
MCVRFFVDDEDRELRPYLESAGSSRLLKEYEKRNGRAAGMRGEIRPSDAACVTACSRTGKTAAYPMKWGYDIHGRSICVNARCETAAQKEMFADGWRFRRCIVPSSWYYEWQHYEDDRGIKRTGQKYAIKTDRERLTWLCGLYRLREDVPEFVILTRPAAGAVSEIHDRMPVIMPGLWAFEWVMPDADPSLLLKYSAEDLIMREA